MTHQNIYQVWKINEDAHICLSCFYIDGFSYQENELVRQNVSDGHDVLVIASTETINPDGKIQFLDPGRYAGFDGADVIRLLMFISTTFLDAQIS